jgi:hypothetical protein
MTKVISAYRGFTATAIKNRASVPLAAGMTITEGDISCKHILMSNISSAIALASNKIGELSESENVNHWSEFGPRVRTYSALPLGDGSIVNAIGVAPHGMDEFAGYNHDAIAPGWPEGQLAFMETARALIPDTKITFSPEISIGEINYPGMSGVCLSLWAGGVIIGCQILDLSTLQESAVFSCETFETVGSEIAVTGKFTIIAGTLDVDDYIVEPSLYDRFPVPNVEDFHQTVKIFPSNILHLIDQYTGSPINPATHPYTITGAPGGNAPEGGDFSWTTGTCGWTEIHIDNHYSNLRISANLYEWNPVTDAFDIQKGTNIEIYNAAWPALYFLGVTSVVPWPAGVPLPAYGYYFELYFEFGTIL